MKKQSESIRSEKEQYVSTRQAAELLGVALRTVQLWVEAGVLSAWKTAGGHRRIPRSSVEALLEQRRQSTQAPKARTAAPSDQGFRILLVEDDDALRKLFVMIFKSWNAPVILDTAEDGFEGLIKLGQNRPDLLITDLNMPGMDGFKMMHHLRKMPGMQPLEIIVMTALRPDQLDDRGSLPGDIRIFSKPVPFDELKSLISDRIANKSVENPIRQTSQPIDRPPAVPH